MSTVRASNRTEDRNRARVDFDTHTNFNYTLASPVPLASFFCLAAHGDAGADVRYVRRVLVAAVRSTRGSIHT